MDLVWITLLCVRVAWTVLLFCLCDTDRHVSLCDGQIWFRIVFDVWYVVTTLYMFLSVYLGQATTLVVEIGLKMGWCTTFEFFECIRETDTTERFFVFGRKTSVFVAMTRYSNLAIAMRKELSLDRKSYHNTVLL